MALVPIRCPSCGASVDLEEGQTVVRCSYCQSTSYLPKPAVEPRPLPPVARPRGSSWPTLLVLALVGLPLMGGLAFTVMRGGVGADYLEDATSVKSVLAGFGAKTRFVSMTLSGRHTYVEVLEDDGTIVVHRFDGGSARNPDAKGKVDDIALARKGAFRLDDVDFRVVSKIVAHAQKQVSKGKPLHVVFQRRLPNQADLLWSVGIDVAGDLHTFFYTPSGEPLVDEPIDFIAAFQTDAMALFTEKLPKEARIIDMYLARDYALVEVLSGKSQRDTDRYRFSAAGVVSAPLPTTSDGDAAKLATQVFSLKDVDGAAMATAVSDGTKHLEGQVHQVSVRHVGGAVGFTVHAQTERGASRTATYDASGKRQ